MRKLFYTAVVVALGLTLFVQGDMYLSEKRKEALLKAQLTVYIAPPLLKDGGTVIVAANPIPLQEWKTLPKGENAADTDLQNAKRKDLKPGDRLFGVVASTKLTIIEFVYPEGGTFGFNLVAMGEPGKEETLLKTREIEIGSGGYTIWKTGEDILWGYFSTVHVYGPTLSEDDSRGAAAYLSEIMNLGPQKTVYEGAVLYSPTSGQVDKAVVMPVEQK